jgi:hypothetical protein
MRNLARGSASVETALACLVSVVFLSGSVFVGRVSLATRRVHAIARHAAALSSIGVPASLIESEVSAYASELGVSTLWTVARYTGSPAASFYRLTEAAATATVPLPPVLGGGQKIIRQTAVIEDDKP